MSKSTRPGTFLVPGPSKNKRLYTPTNIGRAVERMQARLKSGQTIPMHASHLMNAEGNTLATAAYVREVSLDPETNKGRFTLEYADTEAGRQIKAMAKDLRTVSIFGNWVGPVRTTEEGYETADDLDVTSIDFTHRPGVGGAQLDESMAREAQLVGAAVWESFEEGFADEVDDPATESKPSWIALLKAEQAHPLTDGICGKCTSEAEAYADKGAYRGDKIKRFPIDTAEHVRASWLALHTTGATESYTGPQTNRLKAHTASAAGKLAIDVAAESALLGTTMETLGSEFIDAIEAYASSSLNNGQGDIYVSAWTDDPKALPAVGAAVARAALAALLNLDPDQDGDVDLPGGGDAPPGDGDESDDNAMECAACEAVFVGPALFCPNCGQPIPGAESVGPDKEGAVSVEIKAEAVKALLTTEQAAALDPAKENYTQEEVAALLAPAPATETADPIKALAEAILSGKSAPAEETELAKAQRIVAEHEAAQGAAPITGTQLKETLESFGKGLIESIRGEAIESTRRGGGFQRRGLQEKAEAIAGATIESDLATLAGMDDTAFAAELVSVFDPLMPDRA